MEIVKNLQKRLVKFLIHKLEHLGEVGDMKTPIRESIAAVVTSMAENRD